MYRANTQQTTWEMFSYEKNLHGDIVAVLAHNGVKLVSYTYDAWGNVTQTIHNTTSNAHFNPLLYRGYYYDSDLQMYWLTTRAYDPVLRRFISPDDISYLGANGDLLAYNLYAYCSNDPVNYYDPTGRFATVALASWTTSAWWLTVVDGPLPIGDIVYVIGCTALGTLAVVETVIIIDHVDAVSQTNGDSLPDSRERDENGRIIVVPGEIPTEADGYIPAKGGPQKGKTNNGKIGWKDKKGNIWVPAPTGYGSDHGGGHWDVNRPDGTGYANVYPGGHVRHGKGRMPVIKRFSLAGERFWIYWN